MKKALVLLIFVFVSNSYAGIFVFETCYIQGLNANGKVINQKTDPSYAICGDEAGGKTICHFFEKTIEENTMKDDPSKQFDEVTFEVAKTEGVRIYTSGSMATQLYLYKNSSILFYANTGLALKGVIGQKVCSGYGES